MTKYRKYQRPPFKRPGTHPIWRGIGCLMIVIVPVMSYLLALEVVRIGLQQGWPIPPELLGMIQFPAWVWKFSILSTLAAPIANIDNLLAILVTFLILLLLLSGIFSTFYAILYRVAGPPRYTKIDAPPSKYHPKLYKR